MSSHEELRQDSRWLQYQCWSQSLWPLAVGNAGLHENQVVATLLITELANPSKAGCAALILGMLPNLDQMLCYLRHSYLQFQHLTLMCNFDLRLNLEALLLRFLMVHQLLYTGFHGSFRFLVHIVASCDLSPLYIHVHASCRSSEEIVQVQVFRHLFETLAVMDIHIARNQNMPKTCCFRLSGVSFVGNKHKNCNEYVGC